jgi:hypothetical protein
LKFLRHMKRLRSLTSLDRYQWMRFIFHQTVTWASFLVFRSARGSVLKHVRVGRSAYRDPSALALSHLNTRLIDWMSLFWFWTFLFTKSCPEKTFLLFHQ